jgi:hypothetical protein
MAFSPIKPRPYGTPKAAVAKLFEAVGGATAVMELLNLSRTRVYALTDPNDEAEISFSRVCALTEARSATPCAEHLSALAGGLFLPLTSAPQAGWHAMAGAVSTRNAETIASLLQALSPEDDTPGEITPEEARTLIERVDEELAILALARAKLLQVMER